MWSINNNIIIFGASAESNFCLIIICREVLMILLVSSGNYYKVENYLNN